MVIGLSYPLPAAGRGTRPVDALGHRGRRKQTCTRTCLSTLRSCYCRLLCLLPRYCRPDTQTARTSLPASSNPHTHHTRHFSSPSASYDPGLRHTNNSHRAALQHPPSLRRIQHAQPSRALSSAFELAHTNTHSQAALSSASEISHKVRTAKPLSRWPLRWHTPIRADKPLSRRPPRYHTPKSTAKPLPLPTSHARHPLGFSTHDRTLPPLSLSLFSFHSGGAPSDHLTCGQNSYALEHCGRFALRR